MKKLLVCLFAILFITESVYALNADGFSTIMKTLGKDDVSVIYGGKEVGRFSKSQFETLVKDADFYNKLTKSETNGKVSVLLKDDPFILKAGSTFKSTMTITWSADDGTVLKKITVNFVLQTDKNNQVFILYRDLCIYLFPASVFIIIILIILLSVK